MKKATTRSKNTKQTQKTTKVSKAKAKQMVDELCKLYPDAQCELNFDNNYQLLTAVILSAQTTDVQVNKVTQLLFKKYPQAIDLAEAALDDIKEIVRPTGYYNAKANNIQQCAQALVARHGGIVPDNMDELVKLPGVGRKTANVVLGVAFGVPGWSVDTHVQRLSRRFGFTRETDPVKIESDLQKLFPGEDWSKISITIIWHGRRMCYARKPDCLQCPINKLCPSAEAC